MSTNMEAAEKLCWPSLRTGSGAAALLWRNPTANTAFGTVLRWQHSFSMPATPSGFRKLALSLLAVSLSEPVEWVRSSSEFSLRFQDPQIAAFSLLTLSCFKNLTMKTCPSLYPSVRVLPRRLAPARAADQTPARPSIPWRSMPLQTMPETRIRSSTRSPARSHSIAVHNGDIVESVIFIIEFQRAHPNERAVLLTKEIQRYYQGVVWS